ncbi:MAG: T9SS type A sorting domain-containing protein [Winogradskyella sp.]|uniref:T9SS type A sorting domain-containing protein n=1 Tax=Winogradskyella sp. TaxID=1883156 RepID=UPI003859CE02
MLLSSIAYAQSIDSAEYFFDSDPGVGNGTSLTVNANSGELSQTYTIEISSLSDGFHDLYIRTFNSDNNWSHYDRQIIYIKDFQIDQLDVVTAEYFIDSDPGIGFGEPLDISSSPQIINIGTDGLSEGDHFFCIRVQNSFDEWSFYECEIFTINPNLGIEDSLYKIVQISPNSFTDIINIEVSESLTFEKIVIYDITGKEVYHTTKDLRKLELENLESGIYILSLETETQKATFKIVKE